ncbi:MAG: hypothetical protein ACOCXX_00625 [Planctomycetota bacterium]
MSRNITIRLENPDEVTRLIKQLRSLKRTCTTRGGTRRVTFGDSSGRTVMFEACFEIGADEKQEADRPAPRQARDQGELF